MSTSRNNFFQPLDRATPTIRLIKFVPVFTSPIECTFETFNLDSCLPHTALSYTWGAPIPTASIKIDDSLFCVRKNLYRFLQVIRRKTSAHGYALEPTGPNLFWIDALCINQDDIQERNHQVNLMSKIYSRASLVRVWLGPHGEDSDIAMDYLGNQQSLDDFYNPWIRGIWNKPQIPLRQSEERIREAISSLCHRSYWSRLWIIQEVILGMKIRVMCGEKECDWEDIENYKDNPSQPLSQFDLRSPAITVIDRRKSWLDMPSSSNTLDLLLCNWGTLYEANCSDPRDRIFGLLGLVQSSKEATLGLVEANYEKSREDIFSIILRYLSDDPDWKTRPATARIILEAIGRMLELERYGDKIIEAFPDWNGPEQLIWSSEPVRTLEWK